MISSSSSAFQDAIASLQTLCCINIWSCSCGRMRFVLCDGTARPSMKNCMSRKTWFGCDQRLYICFEHLFQMRLRLSELSSESLRGAVYERRHYKVLNALYRMMINEVEKSKRRIWAVIRIENKIWKQLHEDGYRIKTKYKSNFVKCTIRKWLIILLHMHDTNHFVWNHELYPNIPLELANSTKKNYAKKSGLKP